MSWCRVNLICNRNDANIIEEILVAHEAISISMVDKSFDSPIFEPRVGETPLWRVIKISALFDEKKSKEIIDSYLEGIPYSNLTISKLHNQNWIGKYQKNFKPIKIGKRLWVVPSWSQNLSNREGVKLKINPGMAFGSGSHETTHLCLEYLDGNPPNKVSILDYGCGSGILSIASILLGATKAIAVDIDPQALLATKENAIENKVVDKIKIGVPKDFTDIKVDIVIANIFSNTLIALRDTFAGYLESNSKLVLCGIMNEHLNQILDYYEKLFCFNKIEKKNDWLLIELSKK